ncbi:DUF6790 family protein [Subtercola sp. YIM 133946]|uniref:DUF6790 family protein n=1 Tax=Subtercola sp. YIM 133946 TaxID=3118909 RepID=UPI002F93406C
MSATTYSTQAEQKPNLVVGLLPFAGVVLFVIAEIVTLVASGTSGFLEASTLNAVLFLIGSSGIGNGIAHLFFGPAIARSIGWQPGPFQFEVGGANLAIGIAGVVGAFYGSDFWLAVIIVDLIFLFMAGGGHIAEIVRKKNFSINNAGPILFLDFLMPAFTLALWIAYTAS